MSDVVPTRKSKSIFDEIERMQASITRRAYEIFSGNGGIFGRDIDDWLQAEQELVWTPAVELTEKDNEFLLEVAAPRVNSKDLDIEVVRPPTEVPSAASHPSHHCAASSIL